MAKFKNKHGEKFFLKQGRYGEVYMWGDETDNQEITLFNPDFDVYTDDELVQLANALKRLVKEPKHVTQRSVS